MISRMRTVSRFCFWAGAKLMRIGAGPAALRSAGGAELVDPLADKIVQIAAAPIEQQPERFLALRAVFPPGLSGDTRFRDAVVAAHRALADGRMDDLLAGSDDV